MTCVITLFFAFAFCVAGESTSVAQSEQKLLLQIEQVNSANVGWKAALYPKFAMMSEAQLRSLNGLLIGPGKGQEQKMLPGTKQETPLVADQRMPENFDVRERWPECAEVINDVRDQSFCGDCWAVAAAGAFSDRICIKSAGRTKVSASDIDTASCALKSDGCMGARDLSPAWDYYHQYGAVSGYNYTLQKGCKPYPFPPSNQATQMFKTPKCVPKCQPSHANTYKKDKIFADTPISLHAGESSNMVDLIKQEVYANGSIEVGLFIYSDFYQYKSGVYKRTSDYLMGAHAVRLIGWGVEANVPFWRIANSWGADWGEQGFFRIRAGTDEAGIESLTDPYAAVPL